MSEQLKSYKMVDESYSCGPFCPEPADVYLKSEADKLIAELNMRICEGDEDFEIANNQIKRLLKIVRQQKYKRCFAMVKLCATSALYEKSLGALEYFKWWLKWYERWKKLAEQFNEGE
mgnify:CR=1 FL=1